MRRGLPALITGIVVAVAIISYLFLAFNPPAGNIMTDTTNSSEAQQPSIVNIMDNQTTSLQPANTTFDWPMYHRNLAHTGAIPVNVTSIHKGWTSAHLDGAIYAEPLGVGSSVFLATENNSVYSLDAGNGSILWRAHIGAPVPGSALPCGNIDPSGITGTPAIDKSSRTLYAVAHLGQSKSHELVGINIDTGKVVLKRNIDPTGMDPLAQQERAALTIANGMVYVPFGGLWGDCSDYLGWVVGVKISDPNAPLVTYKVPANREAGFWATPGASVDQKTGYLYLASGNGDSVTTYDLGNTVIKLSPSLQEVSSFAPSDWATLNADDTDIGSSSPALVGHNMLFQIGKAGVGYLVNSSSLGGIGGQIYSGHVCDSVFGGTAYSAPYLFVPCTNGLYMVQIMSSSFKVVWHSPQSFFSGGPIVTGNAVWAIDTSSSILRVYNFHSGTEIFSTSLGSMPHFVTPGAGDGMVFAVSGTNRITSFSMS